MSFGPPGAPYREDHTYIEIDRPRRLVHEERFTLPGGGMFETTVTMTLEERDGKTLLTIEQTGFPSEEIRDSHQGGWPSFIDRLEHVVTSRRAS